MPPTTSFTSMVSDSLDRTKSDLIRGRRRVAPPGGRQGAGRSSRSAGGAAGDDVLPRRGVRLRSGPPRPDDARDQRVRPRLSGPACPRRTTPNWTRNSTRSSTRVRSMTCGSARPRARRGRTRQAPGRAGVAGARWAWSAWSGARAPVGRPASAAGAGRTQRSGFWVALTWGNALQHNRTGSRSTRHRRRRRAPRRPARPAAASPTLPGPPSCPDYER